jgi:hypothetical protein
VTQGNDCFVVRECYNMFMSMFYQRKSMYLYLLSVDLVFKDSKGRLLYSKVIAMTILTGSKKSISIYLHICTVFQNIVMDVFSKSNELT